MFLPSVTPENLNQHYWPQPMLDNLFNFRFLSFFYCFCVKGDEKYYLSANGGPKVSQTLLVCDVIIHNQPFIYCLYIASTCINFTRVKSHFHNATVKVHPLAYIRSKRCRKHYHYPYYKGCKVKLYLFKLVLPLSLCPSLHCR